jgi:glycosyltransferase involved in cell wall biosynthesis
MLFLPRDKYDLIVVEKELFPYIPYFVEALLLRNRIYALDYDDYVGAAYCTGRLKKIILGNKIHKLVGNAVLTTVGNKWYFTEFNKGNLVYLPTVIDLNKYPLQKENNSSSIVWIGSPTTVKYLKLIENTLIKLSCEINFSLKIIGATIVLDNRIPVEYISWSEENENRELSTAEIGIMPLEKNLWEKGKCGFKLIQYMASGLAVIGSDLPANEEIIVEKENGFVARSEDDWYTGIKYLFEHPEKSREMGIEGRKRIEENYSYQVWGPKYAALLKGILVKQKQNIQV